MATFQQRLRELREARGRLRQSDVAAVVGVSTQSYSTYENGREPSYDLLIRLAGYFDCTTDYLLGVSDEPKRKECVPTMEVKTISKPADERKAFDDEINALLYTGWVLRDVQVVPDFTRLYAFLQKGQKTI